MNRVQPENVDIVSGELADIGPPVHHGGQPTVGDIEEKGDPLAAQGDERVRSLGHGPFLSILPGSRPAAAYPTLAGRSIAASIDALRKPAAVPAELVHCHLEGESVGHPGDVRYRAADGRGRLAHGHRIRKQLRPGA
jgi:hypothetical protein